jgi:type VI protein secretion system component Hcp
VKLQNVFIENYELVDVPSYGQLEVIGFEFEVISLTYTPYDPNGTACPAKTAIWDITTNTGNPPSAGVDPNCRVGYGDGDGHTYLDSTYLPGPLNPPIQTFNLAVGLNAFNLDIELSGGQTGGGSGTIETGVSLTKGSDQSSANWFYKLVSGAIVQDADVYHCAHGICPYRHELTDFRITEMTFSESQVEEIVIEPYQVNFDTAPY